MNEQETGTVKWFDEKKGYGFIKRDSGESDVFVHYSAIGGQGFRSLTDGERVRFGVETGKKGLTAVDVIRIEDGE
ncbi:MAG: cold-shock protein [Ardenticatenaceae bacterium]|nr:cold-shock protein [Anaerolineales bacterium]MCB8921599.1 cold-shock protein [Ardenticatenaceae bacterium]